MRRDFNSLPVCPRGVSKSRFQTMAGLIQKGCHNIPIRVTRLVTEVCTIGVICFRLFAKVIRIGCLQWRLFPRQKLANAREIGPQRRCRPVAILLGETKAISAITQKTSKLQTWAHSKGRPSSDAKYASHSLALAIAHCCSITAHTRYLPEGWRAKRSARDSLALESPI